MKKIKRIVSLFLLLSMTFGIMPAFGAASGAGWRIDYDTAEYEPGSLRVEIYDAARRSSPRLYWIDDGETLRPDRVPDGFFASGGDYYAVVQYTKGQSGGAGTASGLSDAEIDLEFDLYYSAAYGKPVPSLPAPPENGSADDLLDWYDALCADDAFWVWNEDEEEGYFLDKLTREQIVGQAESWYDPDDGETLDELIVEVLYEYIDAYRGFTYPYSAYDAATKRSVIESLIANPQSAPAGYTPPSPSGGGEPEESGCYSVLHRLTDDEKAAGFRVDDSFFDGCAPLEIVRSTIGTTYDYYTYREIPLYPGASVYYVADGATVPAFIDTSAEDDENGDEDGGPGDFITGEDASDLTGAVPENAPLYVSLGDLLVTTAADSAMGMAAGEQVEPFIDWETVSVGASGAKVDFTKNRRFVTLDVAESGLEPEDGLIALEIELSGGDLGDAGVSSGVTGFSIDMNTYQYAMTRNTLRVKPGTYGKIRVSAAEGDETEQRVFIWEKELGAVTKNATVRAPSRDRLGDAVTTLVFSSLATGEPGPFSPGEAVVGDVMITIDGFRLFAAVDIEGDTFGYTETTASFSDGGAITGEPSPVTSFEATAPAVTKTVNATVRFGGMTFSASAPLEVGAGAIPPTPTGFSAAASDGTVLFTWDAVDFDGLSGYVIKITDPEGGDAVPVAETGGTNASVAIDRNAWGSGPWYFTLSAVGGSEGAPTAPIRVNDPASPFSGVGSAAPVGAVAERNEFRIESGETGGLLLSFTPDPSSHAEPDAVEATLSYKNIAGKDAAATVSLPRSADYSATLAVPSDAAVLGTIAFSCVIDGGTVALDAIDLGFMSVVSTISLVLPESYALAASFDRADLLVGNASFTFVRSGAVLAGTMPRRYLPRAEVTFRIGDFKLPMTGTFETGAISGDSVFIGEETLPDVLRLRVRAGSVSLPVSATGWFVLPDGKTETCGVTAVPGEDFSDFYFDRRGKDADTLKAYVTLTDPSYSLTFLTDEDILANGGEFVRGADIEIDCKATVKRLDEWMYLNVVSEDDGSAPDGDLIIEISDGEGFYDTREWFALTRQISTAGLDPAKEYSMRVIGGKSADVAGDPVTVTVVTDGSNDGSAPTLGCSLLTEVNLSFILRTDQAGVGEATGELSVTADCDVFYKNKITGEWLALDGVWTRVTDSLKSGVSGVAMNFTSRNTPFRLIDVDAGLKLGFGTDARLVREYQATSGRWISTESETIRLKSGQVFFTVPCDENGGISSYGLGSYLTLRKTRAEWTLSDKEAVGDGIFVPAVIRGVSVAETPCVNLRISRQFTEDRVTYVLRSRDGGAGYSKSFEVTTRSDGGTLRHALDDLPYGNYDLLMYVGSGAEQEQLERRFASGEAVAVPATVCGSVTENVTFNEESASVALDMPAEPVSLSVPGIQSITVTPDRETALRGERLTFSVRFACVPGGSEEKRTLALNTFGSGFEIDSVVASVRTASGSVVTAMLHGTDSVSVPQSDEILTGVVLVSGRVTGSTAAWLDAEAGSVNHSKYNYSRGVCSVIAFMANIRAKTFLGSAPVSGRGVGGSVITVTATSERDPGRTVSQEITVARSGYWKTLLVYPTDGFSDTFLVEVRDADGGLLASGTTEYGSEGVLPSRIKIIWYFDDTKNEVVGYPGEDGTFDALNSAVLTFDPAFAEKAVQVEIEFDDSKPDRMGFTDARRVYAPVLRVKPEQGRFAYEYDFLPVSTGTFALSIPELGIEEDAVPYTTKYFTRFPASAFGNMTIDYETLTPFSIYSPDYSATGFSGGGDDAAAFREFSSALNEPYGHAGTFDCDFAEYSFGGVKMGQIEGADPEDPEEYAILPYSGEAHFRIEHDVSFAPVGDIADAVASFGTPDGTPTVYSADDYIRYADDRTDAYIVLNDDGTVDVVVEHTFNFVVDTGKLTSSAPAGLRRAAARGGDGGGLFSMSQSTKETIANIATEVGTNVPKTLVENGKLLANNAAAAEFTTGFIDGMSNALNVAAVGITAGLELKEDSKAKSEMEKLVAELRSKLDKSVAYYNSKLTCYKGGAGDVQRQIAAIRKMADFDLGEVLSNSNIGNKALSGFNVAVSATGFIPVPGAGMVINMLNDSNKELARENQKFYDDTAAWQAYYKAETAMRNAYRKYDPTLCEDHDPEFVDLTDWLKERSKNYTLVDGPVKVKPKRIIDPSGTVYEGIPSNPLAGVTVSIEYLDGDEWRLWEEAPEYNDQLPEYVTDRSGFYRWDVPDGKWRVRYFKEGYNGGEPVWSDEMDVPPVWLDVNRNMISTDPFEAEARTEDGGVAVRFSRPVEVGDIGLVSLECDGSRMQGVSFAPTATEDGLTVEIFAPVVLSSESAYTVFFDGVRTYAGTATTLRVSVNTAGAELPTACATVVPNVKNGSTVPYGSGVALTCETEGAEIFYTLDGTCPCVLDNPARTPYTGPIPITDETTIVAYAVKDGLADGKPKAYVFFAGSPFTDVPADAFYAEPVAWAIANGVTAGTSKTTFSPEEGCTRGQVVTFLWRAAGQPEPKGGKNPFRDVKESDYFCKAVVWAVENGITAGTSKTTFSPDDVCTRGQIVTFLWRASGEEKPTSSANPFRDVSGSDYFFTAVLWAVENGITLGTSAKTFSPSDTCTRAQVVTFLYRATANK